MEATRRPSTRARAGLVCLGLETARRRAAARRTDAAQCGDDAPAARWHRWALLRGDALAAADQAATTRKARELGYD